MATSKKNTMLNRNKQLEKELNEELKKHVVSSQVIKAGPEDYEHRNYYEGIKLGLNDKVVYRIDRGATKTVYAKNKRTITEYDDEGKELIRTYLSNIDPKNDSKESRKVKSARESSNNINAISNCERLRAFIKHDRMLNDIMNDKTNGINKALSAIGMYLKSPMYIPIAVAVYSIMLDVKPEKIVDKLKANDLFIKYLKNTNCYDSVMAMIDKSYKPDLEKTQVIGRGI